MGSKESDDMRMDDVGYNHRHGSDFYIDRPGGAGDWLMLIVKSPAIFRIDGKMINTPANTFVLFTPEFPQYYHSDSEEYYDDWMHFGPDEDEIKLMKELDIPFNVPTPLGNLADVSSIMKNICFEQYSANPNRKESVDLLYKLLLYKINDKISMKFGGSVVTENAYFEKLLWIRESIYRWPGRDYNIDDMSTELSLSRSRFAHLYAEAFGTSLKKDILTARIEKSKEMLSGTVMPIKQIASIVGYGDISYFTRLFRNKTGMTPNQYRENSSVSHRD